MTSVNVLTSRRRNFKVNTMALKLRDYQVRLKNEIFSAWNDGFTNVLAVSPTGSGKAKTLCSLAQDLAYQYGMPTVIKVHRKELVTQLCMDLAEMDVPHNIIAQRSTILEIMEAERRAHGRHFYDHRSPVTVVSLDTLWSRKDKYREWLSRQRVWILDEAAHQLKDNKWGKVASLFPNGTLGVGFTATPCRLDKKGLGRHAFGLFDKMVLGPTVKHLIAEGYLANYKIAVPKTDYRDHLKDSGDSNKDYTVKARTHASLHSHIVGDTVENYKKYSMGQQAIVFADSIEAGLRMEEQFLAHNIPAKLLTGNTPNRERINAVFDYKAHKIKVLINIDLFDEGFDCPGTYSVIMARPTKSLSKFLQMCGRSLRPVYAQGYDLLTAEGRIMAQQNGPKPFAIIIDQVGNVPEHLLPDMNRRWTLDNIIRRREKVSLLRICANETCNQPYDRVLHECPYCGEPSVKAYTRQAGESSREALKVVEGDLDLLDPETLRQMYKDIELEDPVKMEERITRIVGKAAGIHARKNQEARIAQQGKLAKAIARWSYREKFHGYKDRSIKKKFWLTFGESIESALSLPKAEMIEIENLILEDLGEKN